MVLVERTSWCMSRSRLVTYALKCTVWLQQSSEIAYTYGDVCVSLWCWTNISSSRFRCFGSWSRKWIKYCKACETFLTVLRPFSFGVLLVSSSPMMKSLRYLSTILQIALFSESCPTFRVWTSPLCALSNGGIWSTVMIPKVFLTKRFPPPCVLVICTECFRALSAFECLFSLISCSRARPLQHQPLV